MQATARFEGSKMSLLQAHRGDARVARVISDVHIVFHSLVH
jgi:hypothetical protein